MDLFSDFFEAIKPEGELVICNGRINGLAVGLDDIPRVPAIENRWPDTLVEMHPAAR